ncbi:S24 family peptidase [Bordetella hinzii]|uniref:Phage repressor protein n=1 Tax=Bordetella hinzii TaxID=103855 RepID=A0AAN1VHM5_9BORD|nr:S24 family peptidase [Bordetella hinzii]AZW19166.1 phage repressor protein [Bordetella hinzii]
MVEYRDRLSAAMQAANVSASKLAEGLNTSYQAVKKVIDGKSSAFNAANNALAARLLGVSSDWLALGEGDMKSGVVAACQPSPWPFSTIPEDQVRELPESRLRQLEGAIALAIAQMKLGIQVSPPPAAPASNIIPLRAHKPGGLVDMDHADDAFPMRIPGLPAPWEGGRTTAQAEREPKPRLGTRSDVVANVGPGEPHATNDRFEKVPELADVRLAAGEGIENHDERQTGVMQFRRSFLRAVGADSGKARVVYAKGDSMEPVIKDGAALLVVPNEDLTLRDLAGGGVYAINYDGKMIVKTVTKDKLTGRWVARSFNPAYPDIPLENGHPARVLGQVVWAGARLRDDEAGQWVRS